MDLYYLIGVDGGFTSCSARFTYHDGCTLGEGLAGPANIATNELLAQSNIEAMYECWLSIITKNKIQPPKSDALNGAIELAKAL